MSTLRNRMRPIHPGEILRDEYLMPRSMSANALASSLGVPTNRVTAILNGERSVTADTALRLARCLNTTPEFWMNLQSTYDLRLAEDPYCPGGGKRDDSLKRRAVSVPVASKLTPDERALVLALGIVLGVCASLLGVLAWARVI